MSEVKTYHGEEKIVVAIDLGTTQSAVSYAHLYPGGAPAVRIVTKWPGQEEAAGDSKIPSLVCYENGRPVAFGADAQEAKQSSETAELARWFKLHLHPDSMKISHEPPAYGSTAVPELEIPPLPKGVTLKQVYAHFLGYLFDHTRDFFKSNTVDGTRIWSRLGSAVHIVLATPNGWDLVQQGFLREAAVLGGLLTTGFDEERLRFVTEGEASVHYALDYSNGHSWLKPNVVFAVCDAGGSTVDSTLYHCKAISPKLVLEEVKASECVQAGSVFVDRAAESMIKTKLSGSKFAADTYTQDMLVEFEKKTKRKFDGTQATSIIKFGKDWDSDKAVGVWKGRLSLQKAEVEGTFDACVPRIIKSCERLIEGSNDKVKHLLLVGGFGESPYLRKRLAEAFGAWGADVVTVDEATKKAAAEGAAIWFTKQLVIARAARSTFGVIVHRLYDPLNSVHQQRKHKVFTDEDGNKKITGFFDYCVRKNDVIGEESRKTFPYYRLYKSVSAASLDNFGLDIYEYDGDEKIDWGWNEYGGAMPNVRFVCTLRADLSALTPSLVPQRGQNGETFWRVDHTLAILFGGTSLKAKLCWKEGGLQREGPVTVIPNSIYH